MDVTANDRLDADTGPNNELNHPVLSSVKLSGTTAAVTGTLEAEPDAEHILDVYANRTPQAQSLGDRPCDASERGEGELRLAQRTVRTDALGSATFSLDVPGVRAGDELTANVTKTAGGDEAMQPPPSTGEFSPCFTVEAAAAGTGVGTTPSTASGTAPRDAQRSPAAAPRSSSRALAATGVGPWVPLTGGALVMAGMALAVRRRRA